MDGAVMSEQEKEIGVAGEKQLEEKKAERAKYYWPPGATEPILIETEETDAIHDS